MCVCVHVCVHACVCVCVCVGVCACPHFEVDLPPVAVAALDHAVPQEVEEAERVRGGEGEGLLVKDIQLLRE